MTTAAREAEARAADVAFQVALAQIGAGTIEDALAVWREMDPTDVQATTQKWLARAVNLILGRRRISRDLAMAYYRLARALRTGKTIADPFRPEPPYVTLGDLRREFAGLVEEIDYIHQPTPQSEAAQSAATDAAEPLEDEDDAWDEDWTEVDTEPAEDDDERILNEEIEALREEELRREAEAEKAAERDLAQLGPVLLQARVIDLNPDETTLTDAEQLLAEEYRKAGSRVAASSERIVLNGGRGSVYAYGEKDARVIGWVRVSLSGNPCSFCAMLISRGLAYKSEGGASKGKGTTVRDGQVLDAYHDNCRCIAVPIYSLAQYETDPRFDQNRKLDELWKARIKDRFSGNEARNEWRRLIDGGRRSNDAPWVITPTESPYAPAAPVADAA